MTMTPEQRMARAHEIFASLVENHEYIAQARETVATANRITEYANARFSRRVPDVS